MSGKPFIVGIFVLSLAVTGLGFAQPLVEEANEEMALPTEEDSPIAAPEALWEDAEEPVEEVEEAEPFEQEPSAPAEPLQTEPAQPVEPDFEVVAETPMMPAVDTAYSIPRLAINEKIPSFALPNVLGGSVRVPEDVAASYVVILFFRGAWDPYAQKQLQSIADKYQTLKDFNVFMVAISGDDPDALATLRKTTLYPFPILHDTGCLIGRAFNVYRPEMREDSPACFVLNSEDRLVFMQKAESGPESLTVEQLITVITDLTRQAR